MASPSPSSSAVSAASEALNRNDAAYFTSLPQSDIEKICKSADEDGRTIIHAAACADPKNGDAVKALLSRAPAEALCLADEELWTPLHSAASSGKNPAAVALLLSLLPKGSSDPLTSGKRTPLHYAASKGHAEIVKMLLDAGADPAAADGTGARPLHRAAGGAGSLDVLRMLLAAAALVSEKKKFNIDAKDRWGRTALMAAAAAGRKGAALLLVARGSSLDCVDGEGKTALDVATAEGGSVEAGKHLARQMQALASGEHVLQEALAGQVEPPGPDQCIVRALGARGGNLVEVERPDKSTCMVLLPAKFHKKMWIKRGGFLLARLPPEATASGAKLAGEVERVLYDQEVAELKKMVGVWPREFEEGGGSGEAATAAATTTAGGGGTREGGNGSGSGAAAAAAAAGPGGSSKSDSDSDSGLPPLEENPNRRRQTYATSSSSSDDDEDSESYSEEDEEEK